MENTRIAEQAGAPLTAAEEDQARYALDDLMSSGSGALRLPWEQFETVLHFFELGWALGVRTGHTAPALADVPLDRETVARAFAIARTLDPQNAGAVLWQRVEYHGSQTSRHGRYWVRAIHALADPFCRTSEVRYDLCEMRGGVPVTVVRNVRRVSVTPLPEYRWIQ
ncbi:hypothetical protein [Streptomyces sp. NPDC085932]|uniref:hypothetical protein n=1 Tax=Streptomyces sp. NPDC085932 TaxID=3365741 RepID=UPI0037D7FC9C